MKGVTWRKEHLAGITFLKNPEFDMLLMQQDEANILYNQHDHFSKLWDKASKYNMHDFEKLCEPDREYYSELACFIHEVEVLTGCQNAERFFKIVEVES